ncbi:competence protein CoiA [Bacillus tequilensis]|uniref:competence protein CoiA family protein n=2 Tax=Bacillus tequilensis TaxID=227866 RepID=UPI001576FA61|nr:competence protein CoiA family protein [Bacillus tequilensis]NTU26754.1 competence protein CoiA [Bacillus tequilensis]
MFSAVTEDGQMFHLLGVQQRQELKQRRFFCPVCGGELAVKLGPQKAPHFAHKQNKSCSIDIEPESAYHLEGKRQLYVWLKTQQASPLLEPYIKNINQRPDIMANIKGHMLAVEYQCATIAPDVFQKRTAGFKQAGIIPQWIMGYSRLKRTAPSFYQLSAFHWQFINAGPCRELICYCPETRSFCRLSHIIPFYTNHSYCSIQTIPIHLASARHLFFTESKSSLRYDNWMKAILRFRHKPHRFISKELNRLRMLFYEKRQTSLSFLPTEVFVPVKKGAVFKSPVFVWQGYLYLFITDLGDKRAPIHFSAVLRQCKLHIHKKNMSLRYECSEDCLSEAVKQYIDFLCKKGFLRETQKEVYVLNHPAEGVRSLQDLIERDRSCFIE